ncbi:hypothetical protein [Bauldia sp.]|uniref:hypothetical protein n=1 Tax=Bauldia sp. TaxID=2575872 RepID=UPI003BADADF4
MIVYDGFSVASYLYELSHSVASQEMLQVEEASEPSDLVVFNDIAVVMERPDDDNWPHVLMASVDSGSTAFLTPRL